MIKSFLYILKLTISTHHQLINIETPIFICNNNLPKKNLIKTQILAVPPHPIYFESSSANTESVREHPNTGGEVRGRDKIPSRITAEQGGRGSIDKKGFSNPFLSLAVRNARYDTRIFDRE